MARTVIPFGKKPATRTVQSMCGGNPQAAA